MYYFSESDEAVQEKATQLLPAVYEVKFHFFENQLPKLPNGKYDGVRLMKSLSDSDKTTGSSGGSGTATENSEISKNIKSPYSGLPKEVSYDL